MVKEYSVLTTEATEKISYQKARDQSKLILPEILSFLNKVLSFIACYETSQDERFLKELEEVLIQAEEDLKYAPPAENNGLRMFADDLSPNEAVTAFSR